jgi:hypothetical protein
VFNKHVLSILVGGVESQTQLRDAAGSRRLDCNSSTIYIHMTITAVGT